MEDSKFDVIVLGTGLTESVVAAALSKWGFKIAHVDRNPYYGDEVASLTLEEFAKWVDTVSATSTRYSHATRSETVPPFARQYSICLCPTISPSVGPFVDALIHSGVSKYSGFRLLERVAVYDGAGAFRNVPGSKEDVFKNKDISLIQKRRLMRFLTFAVGDFEQSSELQGKDDLPFTDFLESVFSLNNELVSVIAYALAYSSSPTDPTRSVLSRIQRYLRSVGRYGSSPFLVGHYGGVGEISQGFCRTAAVNGAVYILGRAINSISLDPPDMGISDSHIPSKPYRYSVTLEDIPEPLYAHIILGSTSYVPDQIRGQALRPTVSTSFKSSYTLASVARCVAILEHPIVPHRPVSVSDDAEDEDDDEEDIDRDGQPQAEGNPKDKALDTAVLVFPPGSLSGGSPDSPAVVLMTGEGTLSAPKGKYILYISLPVSTGNSALEPSKTLRPYLDVILKLGREERQEPVFTAFYAEKLGEMPPSEIEANKQASWVIPPPVPLGPLGDVADAATQNAEILFHELLRILGDGEERYQLDESQSGGIWPRVTATDNDDEI